jgi:transposase
LVDTLGLIVEVWVAPANTLDPTGLKAVLGAYFATGVQRLRKVWVDGDYRGDDRKTWVAQLKQTHKIDLEVVKKKGAGFTVLPRRWVVERTLAWLLNYRRHPKLTGSLVLVHLG